MARGGTVSGHRAKTGRQPKFARQGRSGPGLAQGAPVATPGLPNRFHISCPVTCSTDPSKGLMLSA
jgi:hypothetical protein